MPDFQRSLYSKITDNKQIKIRIHNFKGLIEFNIYVLGWLKSSFRFFHMKNLISRQLRKRTLESDCMHIGSITYLVHDLEQTFNFCVPWLPYLQNGSDGSPSSPALLSGLVQAKHVEGT